MARIKNWMFVGEKQNKRIWINPITMRKIVWIPFKTFSRVEIWIGRNKTRTVKFEKMADAKEFIVAYQKKYTG